MDIIFSRQAAEELSERYTVLELETHIVEDKILETFCVVPTELIPLTEITIGKNCIESLCKQTKIKMQNCVLI
jgi:hypothetical protein